MNDRAHSFFSELPLALPALGDKPVVSVLIACYNYAVYVEEALQSLQAQTYDRFEAIVCDDGSTDSSVEKIASYCDKDKRFRLLQQPNGGVASALNHAFSCCSGEIVLLLDADDTFLPDKLNRVVAYMKAQPTCGFLQHGMWVVNREGMRMRNLGHFAEQGWLAETLVRRGGRWRNRPASALAFRRTLAKQLFPIPAEQFRTAADAYLFTLAPLFTITGYIDDPLSTYRIHGANVTASSAISVSSIEKQIDALFRINEGVNRRLDALGMAQRLDLSRNVNWAEATFSKALFTGANRSEQWECFRRLLQAYRRDDVYSVARKLLGLLAYGMTMLVPVKYRQGVLTTLLGEGGWRRYKVLISSAR